MRFQILGEIYQRWYPENRLLISYTNLRNTLRNVGFMLLGFSDSWNSTGQYQHTPQDISRDVTLYDLMNNW